MSDISETLQPTSDQLDAIDLYHSGPQTFTVESVTVARSDQPVSIRLREFPRVYRPSKNMRRVLAGIWGADSSKWAGRRFTLYNDPDVTFGRERTGGVRISHMSGIDSPQQVPVILTRGKTAQWPVKPLQDAPTPVQSGPTPEQIAAATDVALLRSGLTQFPHLADHIQARLAELGEA